MKSTIQISLFGTALAILALPAVAQNTTTTTPTAQTIQQRKENQQDRIGQGVKSGELTAGETTNLEKKEADINHEEHKMAAADDGKLTSADKAKITRQQNQLSKQIYHDKHNEVEQNTNPEERSRKAGREPAGSHRARCQERTTHRWRSRAPREQ